jgi:hypothetical protein
VPATHLTLTAPASLRAFALTRRSRGAGSDRKLAPIHCCRQFAGPIAVALAHSAPLFGGRVKVETLTKGRTVEVRIYDRGPSG